MGTRTSLTGLALLALGACTHTRQVSMECAATRRSYLVDGLWHHTIDVQRHGIRLRTHWGHAGPLREGSNLVQPVLSMEPLDLGISQVPDGYGGSVCVEQVEVPAAVLQHVVATMERANVTLEEHEHLFQYMVVHGLIPTEWLDLESFGSGDTRHWWCRARTSREGRTNWPLREAVPK